MSVNINRKITDTFYRYKMPKIIAKIEGRGNGIKTVIVNMPEVAKALGRPPMYPTKYIGCELGAQVAHDAKNDRYIVNGAHDCVKLQDILDGFIEKFVLCKACENPETYMTVKREKIYMTCTACGETSLLTTNHRLITYVTKNPPPVIGVTGASKIKTKSSHSEKNDEKGSTEEFNKTADTFVENVNEVEWSLDTSEHAVKKRMEELSGAVLLMTMNNDVEKSIDQRCLIFDSFLKKYSDEFINNIKEILFEFDRLELKEYGVFIFVKNFFNADILNQLKKNQSLIIKLINNKKKSMLYLLHAIEIVLSIHSEILNKSPFILKFLYDEEIVDEDVIIEWANKADSTFIEKKVLDEIFKASNVFINWLKTAEEESSNEESNSETESNQIDDESNYCNNSNNKSNKHNNSHDFTENTVQNDEDDNIDIDNI